MRPISATESGSPSSRRGRAHAAGAFYVLAIVTAISGEGFFHGRLALGLGLIAVACFVVVTLILYDLFKPVSRPIALLAAAANLAGLSLEALQLHPLGANLALIAHGLYCIFIGLLIVRCGFLPRILGALVIAGGLAWLTDLSIPPTDPLAPYNIVVGFLGEGLPMLWLLTIGVSGKRWRERAYTP